MSDLFGNHIVGFPTRRLKSLLLDMFEYHQCRLLNQNEKPCRGTISFHESGPDYPQNSLFSYRISAVGLVLNVFNVDKIFY